MITLLTPYLMSLQKIRSSNFWIKSKMMDGGLMNEYLLTNGRGFVLTSGNWVKLPRKFYILYLWLTTPWLCWAKHNSVLQIYRSEKLPSWQRSKRQKMKQLLSDIKGYLSSVLCLLDAPTVFQKLMSVVWVCHDIFGWHLGVWLHLERTLVTSQNDIWSVMATQTYLSTPIV